MPSLLDCTSSWLGKITFILPPIVHFPGPYGLPLVNPSWNKITTTVGVSCTYSRRRDNAGDSVAKLFYCLYIHFCTNFPLYFKQSAGLPSSRVWTVPTNHEQVVALWLLDAAGPVLLTNSDILRKGLPAHSGSAEISAYFLGTIWIWAFGMPSVNNTPFGKAPL